jgi:hypothetical protein
VNRAEKKKVSDGQIRNEIKRECQIEIKYSSKSIKKEKK